MLTAKNVIYLVNLSERDYIRKKNKWLPKIKAWVDENNPGDLILPFSVALEERLSRMTPEEEKEELEKIGTTSALNKIMTAGYQGLNLIRYFTAGPEESRAWTIRKGTLAPQAAGVIHGDFEKVCPAFLPCSTASADTSVRSSSFVERVRLVLLNCCMCEVIG